MTNSMNPQRKEELEIDEAWARLQKRLNEEPVNPVWATWGEESRDKIGSKRISDDAENVVIKVPDGTRLLTDPTAMDEVSGKTGGVPRQPRMSRSRKWATAAACVALVAAILSTPVGNTAMAAILNQFRMQNAAIVNESDIRNIFDQIGEGGSVTETMNKFGKFTTSAGTIEGELPVVKLQDTLGFSAPSGEIFSTVKTVQVSPSREASMNLNVDAVNTALKRLGAEQLLPQSVDGKRISIHFPEVVYYDFVNDQGHWAHLTQMNTPVVTVDPSIEIEEALKAVINFPLLPDNLKSSLEQSSVLSGDLPAPLIKGIHAKEISIGGVPVIMETTNNGTTSMYQAAWVSHGQMFEFSGGLMFPDKEKFLEKLQELMVL